MIDSINFLIKDVTYVDFTSLVMKCIYPKKFKNTIYKTYESIGYQFSYKGVEFKYYKSFKVILVIANAHKVLNKRDIHIKDLNKYKETLNYILLEVFENTKFKIELNRIDYCVDIKLPEKVRCRYMFLLNMHKNKYKYIKSQNIYVTSVHKKTKFGGIAMNIYQRFAYTKDIKDKDILRIEIQVKKRKIKRNFTKYGIVKEIDEYWSKECFNEYLINYLQGFLYEGDYVSRKKAKEMLKESNYSSNMQMKLYKFLLRIEKYGIDEILNTNKFYCEQTSRDYIKKLNSININPILLPRIWTDIYEMENLLEIAKKTAEEKYFK